jgi:hypothetical protein
MTMKKSGQAGAKVQAKGLTGRASLKKDAQSGVKVKTSDPTRGDSFDLHALLHGLQAMSDGEFSVRLPG